VGLWYKSYIISISKNIFPFTFYFITESLAQELEMERKSRAANAERDVKSPLSERPTAYYKNSVLFGSAN